MTLGRGRLLPVFAWLALVPVAAGPAQELAVDAREARLHETVSWSLTHEPAGNPFDVVATAVFTHPASGDSAQTGLFWMGDGTYAFRFTPIRSGRWTWETQSETADLHGARGTLDVAESDLAGALVGAGTKFALTDDGDLRGTLHHPYRLHEGSELTEYPADPTAAVARIDTALDTVEAQGFRSLFMSLKHTLLAYGAATHEDHESEDPDLASFALVDALLQRAHARGMTVHFWLWGDEERRQTPAGLEGGVNGAVDRRLQRYIAARLGPLPGWSMAYGFDLEEWAGADAVREWADFLGAHMQLPHLLTAREKNPRGGFDLGADKLPLFSVDDRIHAGDVSCYEAAVRRLTDQDGHEPPGPVLFERRFLYQRDDFWTEERTRRCLWQLTLAGGAGAIWGEPFAEARPYPTPDFYRTFSDFWDGRFLVEYERLEGVGDGWTLATPNGSHSVTYIEDADVFVIDLSRHRNADPVVAVDTLTGATFELGTLEPRAIAWTAPYRSDWAVAAGSFVR